MNHKNLKPTEREVLSFLRARDAASRLKGRHDDWVRPLYVAKACRGDKTMGRWARVRLDALAHKGLVVKDERGYFRLVHDGLEDEKPVQD